uniref:Uncharacterized protein n=1 Tax=Mycena chlorophos TaxID=658473 RepID=A0ABQ0LCK7_MYCCL|nr:predicted protein [Mycena chlorophos]
MEVEERSKKIAQQQETSGSRVAFHAEPDSLPDEGPAWTDLPLVDTSPPSHTPSPTSDPNPDGPDPREIRRIFHPDSGRETVYQTRYDYRKSRMPPKRRAATNSKPWQPFSSRLDFEVADFVQRAMLNKGQTEALISLIRRCASNIDNFTLHTQRDLERVWDLAAGTVTKFVRSTVKVDFQDASQNFEMHAKPLWSWALDIIRDPQLADFLVWDPERDYVLKDGEYVRFLTEPWTANLWWDIQTNLVPKSPDRKLCPFIIYADKSKLSSFGTQKGYPIVARLANVVESLRNTVEWGGGEIVGWLPVVAEDAKHSGKPEFVNFKNAVWHESFYKLLESIVAPSKVGERVRCGDGTFRHLHPIILILAADYEEACVMTLIRGLRARYPCPICYVKQEDQLDYSIEAERRTSAKSQEVYREAQSKEMKKDAESLLKDHGLRAVKVGEFLRTVRTPEWFTQNVFWNIHYSDPHRAYSFDRLHSYSLGIWGSHLWEQLKKHVELGGAQHNALLDNQFDLMPRWRDLNHFDAVSNVSFNDGSKHDDISRMIILASHNFLKSDADTALLRCVRSYQELNMYVSKHLHTSKTIAKGKWKVDEFGAHLQAYIGEVQGNEKLKKNWIVPKAHSHKHAFEHIEEKGVSKNFGTHYNESMHGPTRQIYLNETNFREVAAQILKFEHRRTVCTRIRSQIDDLDAAFHKEWAVAEELQEDNLDELVEAPEVAGNFSLGSPLKTITLAALEAAHGDDLAFATFRSSLSRFLNNFFRDYQHELPGGQRIDLTPSDSIIPYQYLRIFYESVDDWSDKTDYLRCNPNFYGESRYDCALIRRTQDEESFVRLRYLFRIKIGTKTYPLALVQRMERPKRQRSARDKALKLYRLSAKDVFEFIPVQSIIRGVVLAPAFDKQNEYMVADLLDHDMFFRLEERLEAA